MQYYLKSSLNSSGNITKFAYTYPSAKPGVGDCNFPSLHYYLIYSDGNYLFYSI